VAPFITPALQAVLQYIHEMSSSSAAIPDEWRRAQISWQRSGTTLAADHMVTSMDIVNITNSDIDNSWTDSDHSQVVGAINAALNDLRPQWSPNVSHIETRLYRMQFTDPPALPYPPNYVDKPFVKSGPPVWTVSGVGPGLHPNTGAYNAPQVAISTTDRTPYRRHWGRNYWPAVPPENVASDGHYLPAFVDAWATGLEGLYANLSAQEFFPVVTVSQIDSVYARGLLTVTELQVDDVPDVVRRRRPRATTYRKQLPAPA